jgi:hypothetical protein
MWCVCVCVCCSGYCADCVKELIKSQWKQYTDLVGKETCRAALLRYVHVGIRVPLCRGIIQHVISCV